MESSIYSIFSKSVVEGVEKFLIEIDQKDAIIPDDMVACFRNMSRTLQRILSKCDKSKSQSKGQNDRNSSNPSESEPTKPYTKSLFDDCFLLGGQKESSTTLNSDSNHENHDTLMKRNHATDLMKTEPPADVQNMRKKLKKAIESDEEIDHNGTLEDSILNLPKISEIEPKAFFKCEICDITMSINNSESHLSGKSHRNKARESSSGDRKSSVRAADDDNIANILEAIKPQLTKNKAGKSYIVHRALINPSYYCSICKVEIALVTTNLMQHVLGQQHKRLCEDSMI